MENSKLLAILLSVLLVLLSGCLPEKGGHGGKRQIELVLKDGGTVTLVCPEYESRSLSGHGRECYIKKSN